MKTFKQIDILISIILIVFFTVYTFIDPETFFIGYFFVGGWQIISMIVHESKKSFSFQGSVRRGYHIIILGIVILTLACLPFAYAGLAIAYLLLLMGYILLFFAPVMAIFYTCLCYSEYQTLKRRALIQLR